MKKLKNKQFCAPGRGKDGICYSYNSLVKIANLINSNSPSSQPQIKGKNKRELYDQIHSRLKTSCGNKDWCWLEKFRSQLGKEELNDTFRAPKPQKWYKNKYTWLTTTDINHVMKQYEKKYEDFLFLGVVPVDCPIDYRCELTNISLPALYKKGIRKIGIIYNLDKHNQPGSHWVSLFVNLNTSTISYYDSYGELPPKLIKQFMFLLYEQLLEMNTIPSMERNATRNQFGHSECGMFSMMFLIQAAAGRNTSEIVNDDIMGDEFVNNLRDYLYRPS